MDKEHYIFNIERKLTSNEPLTSVELNSVITALRESTKCFQEPYYEVIYHDEVDNTETRVMNPKYSGITSHDGFDIQDDYFDLHFKRIIRKEEK